MIENSSFKSSTGQHAPWLEVVNRGTTAALLHEYKIQTVDDTHITNWIFPEYTLGPAKYTIIWDSVGTRVNFDKTFSGNLQLTPSTKVIRLFHGSSLVDSLQIYSSPRLNESVGKLRNSLVPTIHFTTDIVSPGKENGNPGHWMKLSNLAEFGPRDSSPNAILSFKGRMWLLAGYRKEGFTYVSKSDIWSSVDGYQWELENDSPPFYAYSGFVVFKNKMWAFDGDTWSSEDGVNWEKEASDNYPFGYSSRVVVLNDKLWAVKSDLVATSSDGITWEIVNYSAPWGPQRSWPGFAVLNGKMWLVGGGAYYRTGYDEYYNDVWSSADGVNWELETINAPWDGSFWHVVNTHDNKLWVLSGFNIYDVEDDQGGQKNGVWFSSDGKEWLELKSENQWGHRHASFNVVHNDALYLIAGGADGFLYGDVWVLKNKFYFLNNVDNVTLPASWTNNYNGTGNSPTSLQEDHISLIVDKPHLELRDSLLINGVASGIQIGSTRRPCEFTVSRHGLLIGLVELEGDSRLTVYSKSVPTLGRMDPQSKISISRKYGDPSLVLASNISSFKASSTSGSAITISTDTIKIMQAGFSQIFFEQKAQTGTMDLHIEKKELVVTTNSQTKKFGEINPLFEILYQGFALGDSIDSLPIPPWIECHAEQYSPAGTYSINVRVGESSNYEFIPIDGTLTIEADQQHIILPNPTFGEIAVYPSIEMLSNEENVIRVFNCTGQIVYNKLYQAPYLYDLSTLPSGMYLVRISQAKSESKVYRIVKL